MTEWILHQWFIVQQFKPMVISTLFNFECLKILKSLQFKLLQFIFNLTTSIAVRNSSCRKVMFSHLSVCQPGGMQGSGVCMVGTRVAGVHALQRGRCAWRGMCGGGMHGGWQGGVHGRGTCMAGGHAWQGACVAGRACVAGGCVGWRGAWQERRPLQRTVRIPLECILVLLFNLAKSLCFPLPVVLLRWWFFLSHLVSAFICERRDTVQRRGSYEAEMQMDGEFAHHGRIWDGVVVSGYLDRNRTKQNMTTCNTVNRPCFVSTIRLFTMKVCTLCCIHTDRAEKEDREGCRLFTLHENTTKVVQGIGQVQ